MCFWQARPASRSFHGTFDPQLASTTPGLHLPSLLGLRMASMTSGSFLPRQLRHLAGKYGEMAVPSRLEDWVQGRHDHCVTPASSAANFQRKARMVAPPSFPDQAWQERLSSRSFLDDFDVLGSKRDGTVVPSPLWGLVHSKSDREIAPASLTEALRRQTRCSLIVTPSSLLFSGHGKNDY